MATEREDTEDEDIERREDTEDRHEVDLEATEPDDEGEGGEAEEEGRPKPTRAERRAERGRLKQEADELRNQNRELSERVARMEGALETSIRDTRARAKDADQQGNDPLQAELDDVLDQQEALAERVTALGEKMTPEQEAKFRAKARQLDIRKQELIAERVNKRNAPREDPNTATRRGLEVAYADVYASPAARNYAKAEFLRLVNHPNEALRQPDGLATVKLALENTRKEFGMSRAAPTERERARTSGVSRGGTGGGGRSSVVTMGNFEKSLADKAFPHIKNDKERYDKWAKTAGKKMLERRAQRAAGGKR